jgi:hypothetical protein
LPFVDAEAFFLGTEKEVTLEILVKQKRLGRRLECCLGCLPKVIR